MNQPRPSAFGISQEQEKALSSAQGYASELSKANLQFPRGVGEFRAWKLDEDVSDQEENDTRDPAIVSAQVVDNISFLRKLKFQYLEQNAKDRYVKSIVSDIDDAPIVTADDNNELLASNAAKKERLKIVKAQLTEKQKDITSFAPLVEQDYRKVEEMTNEAATLAQKIIDARLALTRLRKIHPNPRMTIPLADQKLIEQVEEMQALSDEIQTSHQKIQSGKDDIKKVSLELESLSVERADAERAVKQARTDEDDCRLVPLYDWYMSSMHLHHAVMDLHKSHAVSENELRLEYAIDPDESNSTSKGTRVITITLIFTQDTRQLALVQTQGIEELGVDVGEVIDERVPTNDVYGVVAAILERVRSRDNRRMEQ